MSRGRGNQMSSRFWNGTRSSHLRSNLLSSRCRTQVPISRLFFSPLSCFQIEYFFLWKEVGQLTVRWDPISEDSYDFHLPLLGASEIPMSLVFINMIFFLLYVLFFLLDVLPVCSIYSFLFFFYENLLVCYSASMFLFNLLNLKINREA